MLFKASIKEIRNGLSEGKTLEDIAKKHGVSIEHITAQFEIGRKVEQEHAGDTTPDEIAMDHLFEDADYYTKLKKMEKTNAKQFPRVYYAKHMQAGICGYKDETILIEADQMKAMAPSFVGKPVYVYHQSVDVSKLKEEAAGYISDSFYNESDGWLWVKMLIVDDEAHEAIAKGWRVSNAYVPTTSDDAAGTWHNCNYDRKILSGEFTHLAIVPDPRYEEADILTPEAFKNYQSEKKNLLNELHNSKDGEKKIMFKLFKNARQEVPADKIDTDTMVELEGGKTVSLQEMINAVADEKKPTPEDDLMNSEVDVGGEKLPVKELVARYNKMNKKNEAEDTEKDKAEDKAEDKKENSLSTDRKHFDELRNAGNSASSEVEVIETTANKLARGKSRYGSGK